MKQEQLGRVYLGQVVRLTVHIPVKQKQEANLRHRANSQDNNTGGQGMLSENYVSPVLNSRANAELGS